MLDTLVGRLRKFQHFGFVIPHDRMEGERDYFITKENMKDAKDGDKVEIRPLVKYKGKKPEAKVIRVLPDREEAPKKDFVIGIYSGGSGDFGFVDVEGQEKGYFVYGKKKNGAQDGDLVKAELQPHKDKIEAVVIEIMTKDEEVLEGQYSDAGKFGFVLPDDKSGDIFIAGSRKLEAQDRDRVVVKIIKRGGKNPEGVIIEILK